MRYYIIIMVVEGGVVLSHIFAAKFSGLHVRYYVLSMLFTYTPPPLSLLFFSFFLFRGGGVELVVMRGEGAPVSIR